MSPFQFPSDFRESPAFGQLKGELGGEGPAALAWLYLWRILAYLSHEGRPVGVLPDDMVPMLETEFVAVGIPMEKAKGVIPFLKDKCRMLQPHAGGLVCPRFVADNSRLSPAYQSYSQLGGNIRAFKSGEARAKAASEVGQSLLSDPKLYCDAAGQPLDADQVRRVRYLVRLSDSALFKPDRPEWGWTPDLVVNALAVAGRLSDEQIKEACYTIAYYRNHPALQGLTTERLLPQFTSIVESLQDRPN